MRYKDGKFIIGYTLDSKHNPLPQVDVLYWGRWFAENDRHVRKSYVRGYYVSTVFLGIDHSWSGGKPVLFETMIFPLSKKGGEIIHFAEDFCDRYCTWDEAVAGHARAVKMVRSGKLTTEVGDGKSMD